MASGYAEGCVDQSEAARQTAVQVVSSLRLSKDMSRTSTEFSLWLGLGHLEKSVVGLGLLWALGSGWSKRHQGNDNYLKRC